MAARARAAATAANSRSIVTSRTFDAPCELVFEAWTDPKHFAQWWGPNGFSTTTSAFDFRPGGVWRFVMHGPDGRDYQNRITWEEIVRPERLVYRHGGGDDVEPVQFRTTVTFEDLGGKTRLTMCAVFPSIAERDRVVREYGAEEGARQTVGRLAEYVARMDAARTAERTLVITRVLDAPPSLVFKAWTDPAHARHWTGPRGFTATRFEGEVRPGRAWRVCLRRDETGEELWQSGVYREVVEPERLVFTFAWEGANGRRGHEMLVTVTFAEHQGQTRMTFRQAVFESVEERDGHQGGWTSAFERLAEYLVGLAAGTGRSATSRNATNRRSI